MAIEKEIKITADTGDALNEIKALFNTMVSDEKKAQKEAKKLNDEVREIGKTSKEGVKSVQNIGKAFKGVGLAIKALGIGLLLSAFGLLKDLLSKNQKVVDLASTAFEGLSIAFNDLFEFITTNFLPAFERVQTFFNNLTFDKIKNAIQDNLIERFKSALEVLGFLQEAVIKFFKGDFSGALNSAKEAGKEFADVMTGVDDTIGKVSEVVSNVTDAVVGYTKSTLKAAAANVELKNTAELAAAQQARLVEQFDRQAEIQRQIRDDESKSIDERVKANELLGSVLKEQEKSMLKLANLQIASAQATLRTNDTIENQVALTEALANKEAVLAQITGFKSEQLVNEIALKKEAIQLDQTITDAEAERRLAQLEFDANQELNEIAKLERLRERLDEENLIIEEDLLRKQELYKVGTQARVDAEQEYLTRKDEINNEILLNEQELKKAQTFEAEQLKNAKINIAGQTLNVLGSIAKEGSDLAKGLAIADIVREQVSSASGIISNTALANAKAVAASPVTLGQPFVTLNSISAGLGIAGGIAGAAKSIKAITSGSKTPSSSSNSGVGGGGGGAQAPSFNLVEGTGSNQIADTIQNQNQPIKAFVVSGDVTSSQELDRNIVENASL